MRLQKITVFWLLFGLIMFYGYASFSSKWSEYNLCDYLYYFWDKSKDCLLLSLLIKMPTGGRNHLIKLRWVFIVRLFCGVLSDANVIEAYSKIWKLENIICFVWVLFIINSVWKIDKTINSMARDFYYKIKKR